MEAIEQPSITKARAIVLPGWERPKGSTKLTEYVGTSGNGKEYYGTSFASACASGLVAALWSEAAHSGETGDSFWTICAITPTNHCRITTRLLTETALCNSNSKSGGPQ